MQLIIGFMILVAFDQLGAWLMHSLGWPIPGSVVGLLLLFLTLVVSKNPPQPVVNSAEFILRHLAFFFVPAGVGIMLLFDLIVSEWLAMLVSMVASTLISLLFTAWFMRRLVQPVVVGNDDAL